LWKFCTSCQSSSAREGFSRRSGSAGFKGGSGKIVKSEAGSISTIICENSGISEEKIPVRVAGGCVLGPIERSQGAGGTVYIAEPDVELSKQLIESEELTGDSSGAVCKLG
jgi:predicted enzyme related to lactoylglutathione lyase